MADDGNGPGPEESPSKSEMKRRMTALQALGESLTQLSENALAQIPLEDERLATAIREARTIRSRSARRRHLQFIGKLMREVDAAPIERAMQALHGQRRQAAADFHELEQLRDELLGAGDAGVERVIGRWPQADRQHLRQLLRQHRTEVARGAPATAHRKLFRYLRELQERYG